MRSLFGSAALVSLSLTACTGTPSEAPPVEADPPTLTITSPLSGATVMAAPDADRSLTLAFETTGVTLKPPGSCLASDEACGHVVVLVDGESCNGDAASFNTVAWSSPARANLATCEVSEGTHTVTLRVAKDNREPWLREGATIEDSIDVTAEIPPLLDRLGGEDGLEALAAGLIEAQLSTASINAYFRNASVNHELMETCMAARFVAMAGGPAVSNPECATDMAAAHAGLGISTNDFDDWMAQFDEVAANLGIAPADVGELRTQLAGMGEQIIEDPDNNATLYQRLGRRPGIWGAVQTFASKLGQHAIVSRYFLNDEGIPEYSDVFSTCLTRQLGSLDGPFIYGEELPYEPALVEEGRNCRSMLESHDGVTSAAPQEQPIGLEEFLEVAGILVDTLLYYDVPQEDIDLLLEAMNVPVLCQHILGDPVECDALFPSAN